MALFFWVRDISCSISLMLREVFIVMRVWVGGWGLEEVKGGRGYEKERERKTTIEPPLVNLSMCVPLSLILSLSHSLFVLSYRSRIPMAAGASEGGWSCRKGEVQKEEEWILFPVDWLGGRSVVDVEQRKTLELDVANKTQKNNLFSFFLPSFFDKKQNKNTMAKKSRSRSRSRTRSSSGKVSEKEHEREREREGPREAMGIWKSTKQKEACRAWIFGCLDRSRVVASRPSPRRASPTVWSEERLEASP